MGDFTPTNYLVSKTVRRGGLKAYLPDVDISSEQSSQCPEVRANVEVIDLNDWLIRYKANEQGRTTFKINFGTSRKRCLFS